MASSDSELEFTTSSSTATKRNKSSRSKVLAESSNYNNYNYTNNDGTPSSSEAVDSSDDEEEEVGYGKQKALGIDPLEVANYDGVSAPQNGSQYLLSVMKEAKQSPKVKSADVSKIKTNKKHVPVNYLDRFKEVTSVELPKLDDINQYIPDQRWREDKMQEFSLLRSKIERLRGLIASGAATNIPTGEEHKMPAMGNRILWQRFCLGAKFEELVYCRYNEDHSVESVSVDKIISDYFKDLNISLDEEQGSPQNSSTNQLPKEKAEASGSETSADSIKNGNQPLLSFMIRLPQLQVMQLLSFQSELVRKSGFLNRSQGEWLYALLACVDKPLEPSTMGDIRQICKCLISIRNTFCLKLESLKETDSAIRKLECSPTDVDLDEEEYSTREYINSLNLFIYLVGDYFNQKDLVMNIE